MQIGNIATNSIVEVLTALSIIIGIIFVLAWLVKKTPAFGVQRDNILRVIQTIPLGHKERIVLVELEGRKIILGVTANQISTLWCDGGVNGVESDEDYAAPEMDVSTSRKLLFSRHMENLMSKSIAF